MVLAIAWSFMAVWLGLALGQAQGTKEPSPCTGPGSICAEFDAATVVMTATVVSVSPEPQDPDSQGVRVQSVVLDVMEGIKGTTGGRLSADFNVANTEERRFSPGETVVVYLRGSARSRWTVACTRTRRITPEDEELATLRELVRATAGGALEGSMRGLEGERPPALPASSVFDHLEVTAESLERKEILTVKSQAGGYFLFPWLEPGRYRIRVAGDSYAPIVRDVKIEARQRCLILAPIIIQQR